MFLKKFFISILFFATLISISKTSADPIPIRGVVEGFYGTPFTNEQRVDLFKFCREFNFNAYIYAPKDDSFHRENWRVPYPQDKLDEIKILIDSAKKNNVKFIFAVSPGLDLNFSDDDLNFMVQKLSSVYNLGCRDFAIFFDDIENKDGFAQAQFLNSVEKFFINAHDDISPLITVPTEYFQYNMFDDDKIKSYTKNFSENLSKNILVLYTGKGVALNDLSDENFSKVNKIYKNLGIWWNYPVNDYMESKLALGPIDNLPKNSNINAVFFNPMKFYNLSKISLATGADYTNDPQNYISLKSWNNSIEKLIPSCAEDFKMFADHSQHLKNNWANIGNSDGKILKNYFDEFLKNPNEKNFKKVQNELNNLLKATKNLQKKLPKEFLNECKPQLEQFQRILYADLTALKFFKTKDKFLETKLRSQLEEIKKFDDTAKISNDCARKFIDEVLNLR